MLLLLRVVCFTMFTLGVALQANAEPAKVAIKKVNADGYPDVGLKFVMAHMLNQSVPTVGVVSVSSKGMYVDLDLLPSEVSKFVVGQTVYVYVANPSTEGSTYKSTIESIQSVSKSDASKPGVYKPGVSKPDAFKSDEFNKVARVSLAKFKVGSNLKSGAKLEGRIVTNAFLVDKAVEKSALQVMDGQRGVMVLRDNSYYFTPLELGQEGDVFVEVKSGVATKDIYVNRNAQLITIDLQKN